MNGTEQISMLRAITKNDIPQLLVIENSVHVIPWTQESFRTCFSAGYLGWCIELENQMLGFIIVSQSIDECHVLNLCVSRKYQHQGWGHKLLEYALDHARKRRIRIAYLEVRRSNVKAISLYQKMQFNLVGERKGYYPTVAGQEDALIFAMSLL